MKHHVDGTVAESPLRLREMKATTQFYGSTIWALFCLISMVVHANQVMKPKHSTLKPVLINVTYITYTVSAGEGFNLNRDVYIRAATLMHQLRKSHPNVDARLALFPWSHLPHWRHASHSLTLPWSAFFDVEALNSYVPVEELHAVNEINDSKSSFLLADAIYELLPLAKDGGWDFSSKDLYRFITCPPEIENRYKNITPVDSSGYAVLLVEDRRRLGLRIRARRVQCVAVQGKASTLEPLLVQQANNSLIVLSSFDRMLHNRYGSPEYWNCRKSMRYAAKLIRIAEKFRSLALTGEGSGTANEKRSLSDDGLNVGGPYIALHVRRGDFTAHRRGGTLDDVCRQIFALLAAHDHILFADVSRIFVASDELDTVMPFLRECLSRKSRSPQLKLFSALNFASFLPDADDLSDGELAILDQIIASHARLFIGTCDSTFTMRIQEDREINQLAANTSYNCFCNKQERTMRDDYGKWTEKGPCFVLRPWRMVKNDEDFFKIAFDPKPFIFVKNESLHEIAMSRAVDEL